MKAVSTVCMDGYFNQVNLMWGGTTVLGQLLSH